MFIIFGQFWNQTSLKWDWQQVGGQATSAEDAEQFAAGFAREYGLAAKIITRHGVKLYLPPVLDESALQNAQVQ